VSKDHIYTCWSCLHRWKGPLVEQDKGRCPECGRTKITFVSSPDTVIPKPPRRQGRRAP